MTEAQDKVTVTIDGREVPLEAEPTAALAATLAESPIWEREIKGFFFDLVGASQTPNLLFSDQIKIHVIELPKFRGQLSDDFNSLDEWTYFFDQRK